MPTLPVSSTHGYFLAVHLCNSLSCYSHEQLHYDVTHFPQSHRSTSNLPHSFIDYISFGLSTDIAIRCYLLSYIGCCLVTPSLLLLLVSQLRVHCCLALLFRLQAHHFVIRLFNIYMILLFYLFCLTLYVSDSAYVPLHAVESKRRSVTVAEPTVPRLKR